MNVIYFNLKNSNVKMSLFYRNISIVSNFMIHIGHLLNLTTSTNTDLMI